LLQHYLQSRSFAALSTQLYSLVLPAAGAVALAAVNAQVLPELGRIFQPVFY